jgi:predicted CoA-substrate-specific enzyme activase
MNTSWQLGVDVGSVHVKVVAIAPQGQHYSWVRPARGRPIDVFAELFPTEIRKSVGNAHLCMAVTGIGQGLLAGFAGAHTVNEVMATARAAAHMFPGIRTVVDMGGQSSKWILLAGSEPNPCEVRDFATNGLCAAGTGAFLEQQASRLQISVDTLGKMASTAPKGCAIAGRCTVFAKSDMIHLQQKGTPTAEIAYGLCLALVRTFMTTVMHGRKMMLPVLFVGGGAANPGLVRAFRDLLGSDEAVIVPQEPMCLGALGAAQIVRAEQAETIPVEALAEFLANGPAVNLYEDKALLEPLVAPAQIGAPRLAEDPEPLPGPIQAFLGVDVGSVSTNLVLLNTEAELIQGIYLATRGEPLAAMNEGLDRIRQRYGDRLEILGVGVTGSGRYLAAQVLRADVVRNEITAQLTSAAHYFGDVDTVFEIGGQDSKYIEATGGRLLDFEMNKICSAGTGSFLEEQAQRLGIDICVEFAKHALSGTSPCDLGTRCTVFMDSELVRALQQGASVDNLCAGLAYSVARNYLDKVVAGRPIGKTIVFQGGTASNGAVVAAFRKILGRDVHIHPYNRLSGAIGVALLVARHMECTPYKTNFAGLEACKVATVSSFECKRCENRCQVNRVTISGRTVHFGDICERYTEKDLYRSKALEKARTRRPFPELFALREHLLEQTIATASPAEDNRPRVGIPRASLALEFLPFWVDLVSDLGFAPVVSSRADPPRLAEMARSVPAEVCLPLKAAAACVASLIHEQQVPHAFVPSLLECVPRKEGGETHTCLYAQQFPDMLRAEYEDKLIHAQFAFGAKPWDDLEGARALAKAFHKPLHKVFIAMDKARKVYEQFVQARENLGRQALQASFDRAVIVLGKPYNTHDPGLNLFLARYLERLSLPAIPWDCLPLSQVALSERWDSLPWHYNREQLRALEFIRSDRRLFPVLISNYGCGPDAFAIKHLEEMLRDKPRLFLEFDEHHGEAGLVTRLEAFADEIDSHIALGVTLSATARPTRGSMPRPCGKRLFIPNFSEHAHIYAAVLRSAGLDAQVLPTPDAETLRLGEELSSGRECHPFSIILGELARLARSKELQEGDVFVSPSTTTPCLIRQYGDAYRILAERAQLPEIEIWDAAGREIGHVVGMSGLLSLYEGLTAVDFLYVLATRLRAYEQQTGTVDAIFTDAVTRVSHAVANKRSVETELAGGVRALLATQRDGSPGDRPIVGVTGDLYTRIHPVGNRGLFRHLESMGCEVWPSPYFVASVDITAWRDSRRDAHRLRIKDAFWETLSWGVTTGVVKRLFRNIDPQVLALAAEQKPSRLVELAEPFVSEHTNWLVLLGVGKIADFIECGVQGVINAVAVHCMVGVAIDSALPLLRGTYPDVPIITLTYGSTEGPAQHIRLETFVHTVLERSKHTEGTAEDTLPQGAPS